MAGDISPQGPGLAAHEEDGTADKRIDLNSAALDELTALPGVGKAIAKRILALREELGRFTSLDQLKKVEGISPRLLKELTAHLRIDGVEDDDDDTLRSTVDVVLDGPVGASFVGHTIAAEGRHAKAELGVVPFAASALSSPAGGATLPVPHRASLLGDTQVVVLAPDGARLASRTFVGSKLPQEVHVEVAPQPTPSTQPNDDPAVGRPTRLRGRVIDEAGARIAAGLQVVLWGATTNDPEPADFRALVVAETDGMGHFTGPYPLGDFTAAHATVAVDDPAPMIPVHLELAPDAAEDAPVTVFPSSVILVVDLTDTADHDEDDCQCGSDAGVPRAPDATDLARADGTFSSDPGAGRCVDFTKPDRTLEEFTYSYAVRTTEPEIRGLTLDEPARVSVGSIKDALSVLTATRRGTTGDVVEAGADDVGAVRVVPGAVAARATTADLPDDLQLDARTLQTLARDPDGFSLATVVGAARLTAHAELLRNVGARIAPRPRRSRLTCDNAVDWDDDPTIYQACTIAHGHLLRFKQEWVADGYSMGNLLYSLPLAPGQKKQLAIVDWERRESNARTEQQEVTESLEVLVDRDRDINEIVTATLTERVRGGSSSSSSSFAGGLGIAAIIPPVGGLLGVGGGTSRADSTAFQNSSRNTASSALNQLRDRTVQSASSVRSQRSTVVQTVRQGERVTTTTESVANYNHCHAITIQYFEVLRHLLVQQRLVDVQECLFVPLLMSWFTTQKALRWRHTLDTAVPRGLRRGFAALDRIANDYDGSDLPEGRYADENLLSVDGDLQLRFQLTRPRDDDGEFDPNAWSPLVKLFGFDPEDFYNQFLRNGAFKDRVFLERLGPRIASNLVAVLKVSALKADGSPVDLQIDPTLISDFRNDRNLYVTLRMTADLPPVDRADIVALVIEGKLDLPFGLGTVDVLPTGSRVIVESATLRYRTTHHSDHLVRNSRVRNDLTGGDDVRIETPLNRRELRNPREEDKERVRDLLDHLNEHIERYHHVLWSRMSPDRRYMLLDGFEAPGSGDRSVASVVDNELIGIVGNCLVLPVTPGVHLDPTYAQDAEDPVDLLEHYQPNTPIEPSRVAIPTRGIYAEAVMGACNSCEVKEEERFWRWEESPIPDSPAQILPVSTDSRRADPPDLTPSDLPAPLVALQNAPNAPDPTGLAGALALLGGSGLFKDITGLEGTQRNAATALEQAFTTATTFGSKAADLALQGKMSRDIDKAMKTIASAKERGLVDDAGAKKLTETAIRALIGGGTAEPASTTGNEDVQALTETAGENKASVKVTRPTGEKVEVDAKAPANVEDSTRPVILLPSATTDAANRAFHPSEDGGDTSGVIDVQASFRDAPDGARLRWSSPEAGALVIDNPGDARTRVRGRRPGLRELEVALLDAGGTRLASQKLQLSVPQYVRVVADASFDTGLANLHLEAFKPDIVERAKQTAAHVLRRSNVRVYWQLGGLEEQVPAHVPATSIMVATFKEENPARPNRLGVTFAPGGVDRHDERIELYVGVYDNPAAAVDIDEETAAIAIQLEETLAGGGVSNALTNLAATVFGRLLGETLAHEITHGLLWRKLDPSGHNDPPIPGDLMNEGANRLFQQRTGLENTVMQSPVETDHFVDHGLGTIGVLTPTNQALIDARFPTTP